MFSFAIFHIIHQQMLEFSGHLIKILYLLNTLFFKYYNIIFNIDTKLMNTSENVLELFLGKHFFLFHEVSPRYKHVYF